MDTVQIEQETYYGMCELRERQREEITKLRAFKTYVHARLDEAGVPSDPGGPHSVKGCRIGDRLDIVLSGYDPDNVVDGKDSA